MNVEIEREGEGEIRTDRTLKARPRQRLIQRGKEEETERVTKTSKRDREKVEGRPRLYGSPTTTASTLNGKFFLG